MSVRLRPAYNKRVRIIGVRKSRRAHLYRALGFFAVKIPSSPIISSCILLQSKCTCQARCRNFPVEGQREKSEQGIAEEGAYESSRYDAKEISRTDVGT
jgi:hypothetical protein